MTSPKRGTTTRNACNRLCKMAGGRIIGTVSQEIVLGRTYNWRSSRALQQDSGFFRGEHETEFVSSSFCGLRWSALKSTPVPIAGRPSHAARAFLLGRKKCGFKSQQLEPLMANFPGASSRQTLTLSATVMTSLADFDERLGTLLAHPTKDHAWYCEAFDFVDAAPELASLYSLKKSLILMVCGFYRDSYTAAQKTNQTANTLYIMESESMGAVKIGRTYFDAEKRASQIKVGCPDIRVVATFPGMGAKEPLIHRALKEFCVGGEWFSVSPEAAAAVIEKLAQGGAA